MVRRAAHQVMPSVVQTNSRKKLMAIPLVLTGVAAVAVGARRVSGSAALSLMFIIGMGHNLAILGVEVLVGLPDVDAGEGDGQHNHADARRNAHR